MTASEIKQRRRIKSLIDELSEAYDRIDTLEEFVQQQVNGARAIVPLSAGPELEDDEEDNEYET
jgi:hypothetical protein